MKPRAKARGRRATSPQQDPERFNNILRQRLGRFVRKTLSFSKCDLMHELCLRLFCTNTTSTVYVRPLPAKENERGEMLGLTDDELAFYDALEVNDNAVNVLGDETLRTIARELVTTVKSSPTIDWTIKERCGPSCERWSNASCVSTATRRTNRNRLQRRS